MPLDKTRALAEIAEVQRNARADSFDYAGLQVDIASMRACIDRWSRPGSAYQRPFAQTTTRRIDLGEWEYTRGQLEALRRDIEADALVDFAAIVRADLHADMLTQGDHLLAEGYRLAATVIIGATLEDHLRKLAPKHGVPTADAKGAPAKLANINDQLAKAGAYAAPKRDEIASWIRLRNEAAHNEPAAQGHDDAQIRRMLDGVRALVSSHPA
jgi:hypothetical protein